MSITIKTAEDIAGMRVACRLASEVLDYIGPFIKPGITTNEIDKLCHDYMVDVQDCIPAPLNYAPGGYKPYPKSICTSINHQVCHGIPNDKPLKKGDILNIDITTIKDGWHGDTSRTFVVGEGAIAAKRLRNLTYEAMWHGSLQGKPGTLTELVPGMVFTIEPMINAGKRDIKELGDGWTIVTKDHSLSAQWEHTVLVTETGFEVLTLSAGSPALPDFVT